LIDDPLKIERIGKNAREEIKKRPNWNEVIKETEKVYRELVST
jgi:glycosyltransferase involved in cell wall biosynthesis